MPPYKKYFNRKNDNLINTNILNKTIFSLPIYPGIKLSEMRLVTKEINKLI